MASGFEPFIATCAPPCVMPAACGSTTRWDWRASGWCRAARRADGRRLSRLPARRPAAPARARVAPPSRDRDRRGSRHRRTGVSRASRRGRHRRHGRALVPARRQGHFFRPTKWRRDAVAMTTHTRPADRCGLVARRRHRDARCARPRRRREAREPSGARAGPRGAVARISQGRRRDGQAQPDAADSRRRVVDAAIAFTARSPVALALIPLEDVLGLTEQPNLPGTIDEHPNWRRRFDRPAVGTARRAGGRSAPRHPCASARMTPRATMRLQFHKGFTFADAEALVPYFARLGISHVYASPITTARPGSMHGYDVIDPTRVNPELGGEEALRKLVAALRAAGLGLIVDIVPNHMAVGAENAWWFDVLKHGPASRYAPYFDIDWNADGRRPARQGAAAVSRQAATRGARCRRNHPGARERRICRRATSSSAFRSPTRMRTEPIDSRSRHAAGPAALSARVVAHRQ